MTHQQKERHFKYIWLLMIILQFGCNMKSNKRIRSGLYDMEGSFLNSSTPNGQIKYYIAGTNDHVATRMFNQGVLEGRSINLYKGIIIYEVYFKSGKENGYGRIYDSLTGSLRSSEFYFYGKKIGPSYEYDRDETLLAYDFRNFQNEILFSVEYDSTTKSYLSNETDKLADIVVDEAMVDNKRKLRLFCYCIYPPKSNTEYKVCYFDANNNIIDSIKVPDRDDVFYWEEYLDYPDGDNKIAFVVKRYDSVLKKERRVVNYIKSRDDE
jgi:hypothetical protein